MSDSWLRKQEHCIIRKQAAGAAYHDAEPLIGGDVLDAGHQGVGADQEVAGGFGGPVKDVAGKVRILALVDDEDALGQHTQPGVQRVCPLLCITPHTSGRTNMHK